MRPEDWEYIDPSADGERLCRRRQKKDIQRRLCWAAVLLSVTALLVWQSGHPSGQTTLERPAIGEGSRTEELIFEWKGKQYSTSIENKERRLSEDECEELAEDLIGRLSDLMLGQEQTAEQIKKDLHLPERVDGYPFDLTYYFSEDSPVLPGGEIRRSLQPQAVDLLVELRYGDWVKQWQWAGQVAALEEGEQQAQAGAKALLEQAEEENRDKAEIPLPQQMNGETLHWIEVLPSPYSFAVWGGLLWLLYEVQLRQSDRKRCLDQQQELERFYPKLVERLLLYQQAGFIGWQIFEQLAAGTDLPPAIVVRIQILSSQIRRGISITEAYEQFALSCRSQSYRYLMQLMSDDLQKGYRDLAGQLRAEIQRANRERLEAAAKAGERLGTQLLFPMVLLLVLCMALIMIPFLVQL